MDMMYIVRLYEHDRNIMYLSKLRAKIVYLFGLLPRTLLSEL